MVFACALAPVACTGSSGSRFDEGNPGVAAISWPAPPEKARIRYVGSIDEPGDVGARRSFFGKIVDFVTGGGTQDRVMRPYGVALDPEGRILVADSEIGGVHLFDPDEGEYRLLRGSNRAGLVTPVGVAVDSPGRIFVSDAGTGSIVRISPGGDGATRIHEGLARPAGLAFAPGRESLFVVDVAAHRIVELGTDGELLGTIGGRGSGPGEFNYPTNIVVAPDGTLYVTDSMNFRVQHLEADGGWIESFGRLGDARGEMARPKGIAVDSEGHVYVVEGLYDVVNIYDTGGRFLLSFGGPGQGPGQFWLSTGMAVGDDDRIYVADSHNSRIQVFEYLPEAAGR